MGNIFPVCISEEKNSLEELILLHSHGAVDVIMSVGLNKPQPFEMVYFTRRNLFCRNKVEELLQSLFLQSLTCFYLGVGEKNRFSDASQFSLQWFWIDSELVCPTPIST